jgi:RNA polymerase sigma-70 factor (ECF subfamily)
VDDASQALEQLSDTVLLRRIGVGDEEALVVLYRRYVGAIYRFILAQVRDVDDAEDLTADTFARMVDGLATFRGEASFKNWLYQIARNAVRNHRRSARYRRMVSLSSALAGPEPSEPPPDEAAALDRALVLLRPLPPRYRQILELRFLAGRTIEETAVLMGITVGNAKVLQHRALKKAAAVMEEQVAARRSGR